MIKKLRYWFWLLQAFTRKHKQTLIIAAISAFFMLLLGWRFSQTVRARILPEKKTIGMVGRYKPSNLPEQIQKKISVGLTRIGESNEVLPAAADRWEIKDKGKTYIFNIKTPLLWHDRKPFEAYDINYNFTDAKITPVNSKTLKITLKEPFSPLPALLSKPLFREGLIGLGPYRVGYLLTKGEYIKQIKLDPLDPKTDIPETIKFYPTLNEAQTAFKLGEIDILQTIEKPTELLSWNRFVKIEKKPDPDQYIAVFFRTDKPPFDKKDFRKALAFSIPDELTSGQIHSPINEESWAYNNNLKKISYNHKKALEFLEKSGAMTQTTKFTIYTFADLLETANKLREAWSKLGLTMEIKVVNTIPNDYRLLLSGQKMPKDPDQYFLWHSSQKDTNLTSYENPKIDKLLEDGRKTFDLNKRRKIYEELQRYLMDELPAIYLYHPITYTISRK